MAGTITHEWNGTTLIITSDSGTSSCDLKGQTGDMGIRGPQGKPGILTDPNGVVLAPADNYYLKQEVDDAIDAVNDRITLNEAKASSAIATQNKRITNLEHWLAPRYFETDDTIAYCKDVPAGALPFAEVSKIGGMTRKSTNLINSMVTSQTINGVTFTVNADNSITVKGTATEDTYYTIGTVSLSPNTYFLSGGVSGGSNTNYFLYVQGAGNYDFGNGGIVTISESLSKNVLFKIFSGTTIDGVIRPMLNVGDTALPYEPYFEGLRSAPVTEIDSVGKNLFNDNIFSNFGFAKLSEHEYFHSNLAEVLEKGAIFTNISGASGSFTISAKTFYKNIGTLSSGLFVKVKYTDGTEQELPASNRIQGEWFNYIVSTNAGKVVDNISLTFGSSAVDTTFKNFQIERGSATEFTSYTTRNIYIPEAVQSLEGYGEGLNSQYLNVIDFENRKYIQWVRRLSQSEKTLTPADYSYNNVVYYQLPKAGTADSGTTNANILVSNFPVYNGSSGWDSADRIGAITGAATYSQYWFGFPVGTTLEQAQAVIDQADIIVTLPSAEVTDISDILTPDNFIEVEGGGTLIFENEHKYATPSEITYQFKEDTV